VSGRLLICCLGLACLLPVESPAAPEREGAYGPPENESLTDHQWSLPSRADLIRVLSMQDHNTRVVFLGTALFGAVGGLVGTFLLLRKRSLVSDTISHATLPGIGLAFLIAEGLFGMGKSLPILLLGGAVTGCIGMGSVVLIRRLSRIKDDAAMAIVLSVFFGLGIAMMTVVQQVPSGNAAGLEQFIYGKAASMTLHDGWIIFFSTVSAGLICLFLFKEFSLICFDEAFAGAQGWPVNVLDGILLGLITVVTVIGLQAVGLLLVVAMMIIPSAAARFWSDSLRTTCLLSTAFGFLSGFGGVVISALFPRLPAGAVIASFSAFLFFCSMFLGKTRGLVFRLREQRLLTQRVRHQHLLRAVFEWLEVHGKRTDLLDDELTVDDLKPFRAWQPGELEAAVHQAIQRDALRVGNSPERLHLSGQGARDALRVVRNHRLWELFLIEYAETAPGRVDRDADTIEHVLEPEILHELESLLEDETSRKRIPLSPHQLASAGGGEAS